MRLEQLILSMLKLTPGMVHLRLRIANRQKCAPLRVHLCSSPIVVCTTSRAQEVIGQP